MPLFYRKFQIQGEKSPLKGMWVMRPVQTETIDLAGLAEHMATHNTGFSSGQIVGVLTDMVKCVNELVCDSKTVKIPNLGIFKAGINAHAEASVEELTPSSVKRVYLQVLGTGNTTSTAIRGNVTLKELSEYSTETAPEDGV